MRLAQKALASVASAAAIAFVLAMPLSGQIARAAEPQKAVNNAAQGPQSNKKHTSHKHNKQHAGGTAAGTAAKKSAHAVPGVPHRAVSNASSGAPSKKKHTAHAHNRQHASAADSGTSQARKGAHQVK